MPSRKLKVTLTRSIIGLHAQRRRRPSRRSACGGSGTTVVHDDTPTIRGMIARSRTPSGSRLRTTRRRPDRADALRRRRSVRHEARRSAAAARGPEAAQAASAAARARATARPPTRGTRATRPLRRRRRARVRGRADAALPAAAQARLHALRKREFAVVNVSDLAGRFAAGSVVDPEALVGAGLHQQVGRAAWSRSWATATWPARAHGARARGQRRRPAKIEAAGGRVEVLPPRRGAARDRESCRASRTSSRSRSSSAGVLMTLVLLAAYRLGAHVPTPGIDAAALAAVLRPGAGHAARAWWTSSRAATCAA